MNRFAPVLISFFHLGIICHGQSIKQIDEQAIDTIYFDELIRQRLISDKVRYFSYRFDSQVFTGFVKGRHEQLMGYMHQGLKEGLWQTWWNSNSLQSKCNYSSGLKEGRCQYWYNNGKQRHIAEYKKGKRNGIYIVWKSKGRRKLRDEVWEYDHLIKSNKPWWIFLFPKVNNVAVAYMRISDIIEREPNVINGLSLSFFRNSAAKINGINVSPLTNGSDINGVNIGVSLDETTLNGLSISPINTRVHSFNGVLLGLSNKIERGKGLTIGFLNIPYQYKLGLEKRTYKMGDVTGIELGVWNSITLFKGFQCGLINMTNSLNGLSLGVFNQIQGNLAPMEGQKKPKFSVQVGLINTSVNENTLQIGLLNYNRCRKKIFRLLPVVNF